MSELSSLETPAGESKLPERVNTGNGGADQAQIGKAAMAGSLPSSARRGRQNITKEHALEILQSAIVVLQNKGVDVRVVPVYRKTAASQVILVLDGVTIDGNNLRLEAQHV